MLIVMSIHRIVLYSIIFNLPTTAIIHSDDYEFTSNPRPDTLNS